MADFRDEGHPAHWYVVVLRASAAVRMGKDEHIEFGVHDPAGDWRVIIRTRYMPLEGEPEVIPRELWFEILCPAESAHDACERAHGRANTIAHVLSFAMNAGIETLRPEYAFDVCEWHDDHEFFQDCLLDEGGLPRVARQVDRDAVVAFLGAVLASASRMRLLRAIAQYSLALQYWIPGSESLALAHLYMAMEALTPLVRRREVALAGDKEELMRRWAVKPRICPRCGHAHGQGDLDAQVRRRILFKGENDVYEDAKAARIGFVHASLDFDEVRTRASRRIERVSVLVRHAVESLLDGDTAPMWSDALFAPHRDVIIPSVRVVKYVKCTLEGKASALQPKAEQYPHFTVRSSIESLFWEDGKLQVPSREEVTAVLGEGAHVSDFRFEMWGPPWSPPTPEAAEATLDLK